MNVAWVTGANGLIGSHVVRLAPPNWRVIALTRESLDIANSTAVSSRFNLERPALIIHCAAVSRASDCEANPQLAWRVNCKATKYLAEVARDIPLLFLSTDLVFDGDKGLYTEADAVNPLTIYAKTKVAAESAVLSNPRHIVVRTSLNGGSSPTGDRSFTEHLVNTWKASGTPTLFDDEFRSPIFAHVTARALWEIAMCGGGGLFHVGGSERISRYDAGLVLAQHCEALVPKIRRGSQRHFSGPQRSPDTSLDSSKAQALLSFPLPTFTESVREHFLG
jgi:dTDP-4-dehydrorhamnose reductase